MWTYNASALANSDLYKVRFMVGDNDVNRQQIQDEEILYILTQETSPALAAAIACDGLAAKYSFSMNSVVGSLSISAERRMKHYMDLADRLRKGGAGNLPGDSIITNATMSVGGTSVAAKEALADDSDAIGAPFRIGQDDHPANPAPDVAIADD
jgi:hypothetical protein